MFFFLVKDIISVMILMLSPIYFSSTYPVWFGLIIAGKNFSRLKAKAFVTILQSLFNRDIGLQFLRYFLSLSVFGIRDFKIHYGGLLLRLLRLLRPSGTRLTTPFPPQTSNRLRFRCAATGCSASTCLNKKWIRSSLFFFHTTKARSVTMISFSCVDRTSPRTQLDLPLSCF